VKIVVDAMCAEFGGIRTYVEQLLGQWHALHPDDEVHVALRAGSTLATPGLVRHELAVRGPDVIGRPAAQATGLHALVRRERPDVVLATAPTTDPRRSAAPLAVVILDLRSELLPHQFSRGRRALRWASYGRSYQLAAGFLAISQRSLDDLHRLHPATTRKPGTVVHLGADHVDGWPTPSSTGPAIAFGHHTNKNPALVVDAWARLVEQGADVPDLLLLGVSGALRPTLAEQIARHGIGHRVELAPFLPDADFQRRVAEARLVVFPSDFEGFGLPVVEGMALRKPVVIGPDPGALEVAGGHAVVLDAWTDAALADAVVHALALDEDRLSEAETWARTFTWRRTIHQTRSALAQLADPEGHQPMGKLSRVRHLLHRVDQTRASFDNPWQVLAATARGNLRPDGDVRFGVGGSTVVAPARRGALFPVYEVFAEDTYRLAEVTTGLHADAKVIDIGAHVGAFSIAVANALPRAEIWAYEASPSTARYLRSTVEASGLTTRVHACAEALAAQAGEVTLHDVGVGSPLSSTTMRADAPAVTVPAVTIAEAFDRAGGQVDLVKIDAEGIEYDLLLRSSAELWSSVSRVVLEYHEVEGQSPDEIVTRLASCGLDLVGQETMVGNPREGLMWFSRTPVAADHGR